MKMDIFIGPSYVTEYVTQIKVIIQKLDKIIVAVEAANIRRNELFHR